jgi:hypothetical protein
VSGSPPRPRAGPARPVALLAAAIAALAACRGSDPQPLELLALDPFGDQGSLVAGGGAASVIGYTSASRSFPPTLRLVRHDGASPDRTSYVGDVRFSAAGGFTRIAVGDEAAAVTVGGVVRVVDVSLPSLPVQPLPALGDATDLAVAGRWVLAASGGDLVLVARDAPAAATRFTPAGAPRALLGAAGGVFLAFTTTGYVAIDPGGAATFSEVSDPALAGIEAVYLDGAGAVAAGPATTLGRSRLLRLDLTNPAAPVVVRSQELPGAYVAFAWDGGSTSVLAVHGDGDDADPMSFHEGWRVREGADGFHAEGIPLTFWSRSPQPVAAHAGRLFAVEARGLLFLGVR